MIYSHPAYHAHRRRVSGKMDPASPVTSLSVAGHGACANAPPVTFNFKLVKIGGQIV